MHPRRFVILEHTGSAAYKPGVHWDLLCEEAELLRAWEFRQPVSEPQQTVTALPMHRKIYLDYEGPISGDRGDVRRLVTGEFELLTDSSNEWSVRLTSDELNGCLKLTRLPSQQCTWSAVFKNEG